MFLVAATELAGAVSAERLSQGALYPSLTDLRSISRRIAVAVARCARDQGLARITTDEEIEAEVDSAVWTPEYASYGP
jgi:malic enzyme